MELVEGSPGPGWPGAGRRCCRLGFRLFAVTSTPGSCRAAFPSPHLPCWVPQGGARTHKTQLRQFDNTGWQRHFEISMWDQGCAGVGERRDPWQSRQGNGRSARPPFDKAAQPLEGQVSILHSRGMCSCFAGGWDPCFTDRKPRHGDKKPQCKPHGTPRPSTPGHSVSWVGLVLTSSSVGSHKLLFPPVCDQFLPALGQPGIPREAVVHPAAAPTPAGTSVPMHFRSGQHCPRTAQSP